MPTAALCISVQPHRETTADAGDEDGDVERLPFKDDELNSSLGSD